MKTTLIAISAIVAIMLTAAGAYFLGQKSLKSNKTNQPLQPTVTSKSTPTPTPTEQLGQTGTIEGSLSFPSEGIPADLQVCAETLLGVQFECTSSHIQDSKYIYGSGYKLELPPGKYYVYAQVPSFNSGYKAYYSEFVTCGLSINCSSHKPIEVEVSAGATVTDVDPQDWYNQ